MTDQPLCGCCGGPIHDQSYVCPACGKRLRRRLELVVRIAGEAAVTVAKLDAMNAAGGVDDDPEPWDKNPNALYPTELPYDPGAAAAHDGAVNELVTTARHVSEERGIALPTVRLARCQHHSCLQRYRGELIGPRCAGEPVEHPTAVVARWLVGQLEWIRHRPEAVELVDRLHAACSTIERVVDADPDRLVVGQCPCGEYLYGVRGRAEVTCRGCGERYDVETSRDLLRAWLDDSRFSAAEIATLAAYLGIASSRTRVRKLINQWHRRGVIEGDAEPAQDVEAGPAGPEVDSGQDGPDPDAGEAQEGRPAPTFRFADVIARLTERA